jgi:polyketide synthase-associated protein
MALVEVEPEEEEDGLIWRPFEGKLVEIVGMTEPVALTDRVNEFGETERMDINGFRGRVVDWLDEVDKYIVFTFNGLVFSVAEENLEEYDPPDPEDGGFDLMWPQTATLGTGIFASMAAKAIEDNGYCVVQMPLGDEGCQHVAEWARAMPGFHLLSQDLQETYLGEDCSSSKMAWMSYPAPTVIDMDQCVAYEGSFDGISALEMVDQTFTNVAAYLYPYTQSFEEEGRQFECHARTNTMIRTSFDSEAEKESLNKEQWAMLDETINDTHHYIQESKRLCMMYLIDSEGGYLTLNTEDGNVNVPLVPRQNQLVLFAENSVTYTYSPEGRHVALQAWIVDKSPQMKLREEELRTLDGPEEPPGERVNVMSLTGRYPGQCNGADQFWNSFAVGSDGEVFVPQQRWDVDIYYRDTHTLGFSMTCHGGFMPEDTIECFDNKFFGVEASEAAMMAPKDRVSLEVGYETLHRAGYRREALRRLNMGVFAGDSGSDWNNVIDWYLTPTRWDYFLNAAQCSRLSWIFGMTGPCSTAETACSSSLVATGIAHMNMRSPFEDQPKSGFCTGARQALVLGLNTLIGPQSYIGLSGPGMLTHKGRCFTFDHSADGYARGEGIGGFVLKKCLDHYEAMGRLAMLIGSCVNQDGRSASMTAPHGPSQQDVIRASMREAGLEAWMITIAECHGTGTALGDPIEVGSLRGVMGRDRGSVPLLATSAKSNIGHLEAGAGMAGIIKCIMMLRNSLGAPNCHLTEFNPHLDIQGFPVIMETEGADFGQNSGLTGVSSFGFGGTNARADMWGHAVKGPRAAMSGSVLKTRQIYL